MSSAEPSAREARIGVEFNGAPQTPYRIVMVPGKQLIDSGHCLRCRIHIIDADSASRGISAAGERIDRIFGPCK
jgi:hypothetical protein